MVVAFFVLFIKRHSECLCFLNSTRLKRDNIFLSLKALTS